MPNSSRNTTTTRPGVSGGLWIEPSVVTVSSVQANEYATDVPSVIENAAVPARISTSSAANRKVSRRVNIRSSR